MMNNNTARVQALLYNDSDDIDSDARTQNNLKTQDIGIINQVSGAGVTADEQGNIELASGHNLGIYINRESREIALIADRVRVISKEFYVGKTPYHYIRENEKEVMHILEEDENNA